VSSLIKRGFVIRGERGSYRIADPLFERWMRERQRAGTLPAPQSRGKAARARPI